MVINGHPYKRQLFLGKWVSIHRRNHICKINWTKTNMAVYGLSLRIKQNDWYVWFYLKQIMLLIENRNQKNIAINGSPKSKQNNWNFI